MKLLLTFITLIAGWSVAAGPAIDHFTGKTWNIRIVSSATEVSSPACVVFYPGGQFAMSDKTLTMRWDTHPYFPQAFSAVTSPGEHSVTPTQRGVHGYVTSDNILYGSVLDMDGSTFEFEGKPSSYCHAEPASSATDIVTSIKSVSSTTQLIDLTTATTLADPCSISWCGPHDNLLELMPYVTTGNRAEQAPEAKDSSQLNGKFFQFSMPNESGEEERHCWYFGPDRVIDADEDSALVWAPESLLSDYAHGFQSVGENKSGYGIAYQGALIGVDIMYVQGIKAFDGKAVMTYGFGTEQAHCEATEEFY